MSESKKAGQVVFRVVDRAHGVHLITADSMVTDGGLTTFFDKGHVEVASFNSAVGAMVVESATSVTFAEPGEVVAMSAYQPVSRGLLLTAFAWSVLFVVSVGIELYKLF